MSLHLVGAPCGESLDFAGGLHTPQLPHASCRPVAAPPQKRVGASIRSRIAPGSMATRRFTSASDMIHLLPPDARLLIAQFAPHPCVPLLHASRRWLSRWGVANGRYEDWQDRQDAILERGLPVRIRGAEIHDQFFAVFLEAEESALIRSHVERAFDLHVTLGYVTDWFPGTAEECAMRINERWRGRTIVLQIEWMGGGGAAFLHQEDPLARDGDIAWLHSRGYYGSGVHIDPRQLHVSL